MTDVIIIDGVTVDQDTGEILDFPGDPERKIEYAQRQKLMAAEQERQWKATSQLWGRALGALMEDANLKTVSTEEGKTTSVAGAVVRKVEAYDVMRATDLELLTIDEATSILVAAAKTLDEATVLREVATLSLNPQDQARLLALLVTTSQRAGYTRTTVAPKLAPERVKVDA